MKERARLDVEEKGTVTEIETRDAQDRGWTRAGALHRGANAR
ncbi:MAG: hypothetical protein WBC63_00520 [Candidatus Bipolaricaulia bacterium]